MRVCIIGGIFDKPEVYRSRHRLTPETILAEGLAAHGVSVTTAGHQMRVELCGFDIVHVHHLGLGALGAALDRTRAAFVYTHHRPFVGYPSWQTKLVGVDFVRPSLSELRAGAATRLIMRCADLVIALSPHEGNVHRHLYHVPENCQAIIPNGIPPELFTKVVRYPAEPPELLYVGQLVPFKQVDILLRAFAALRPPAILRLVYQVDDLRPELLLQARSLGLGDRVRFEGAKDPRQICDILSRATALVLPSAMEALPSVITEAMLAGVPVIATNVGGVKDQVGANGIVVPPGSAQALTEAITSIVSRRDEWLQRADRIRESAIARFSPDRMVADHLAAYGRVLGRPERRRNDRRVTVWRHLAARQVQPRDPVMPLHRGRASFD